jgi:hypothetical protein
VIDAEMADWVNLGGGNSGCCGNSLHTYGFHLPANAIPASDYSRRHDPNPPVNWNWACAGDFGHNRNPRLLAYHVNLLSRLIRNDPALSMICEFIGQPWDDRPVYYWARWDGTGTLQRYTGSGHDTWSHVSWWRSRANERAYLWTAGGGSAPTPSPAPAVQPTNAPAYPGYLMTENPGRYDGNVKTWQARMAQRGWTIGADGYFGSQTLNVVRQFQQEKNLGVDGIIGPKTWGAAWTMPVT